MSVHAFTSFSYSYLNRARVLARSIRRHHPDWTLWAVLIDKVPDGFEYDLSKEEFDCLLTVEELFPEYTNRWLFGHDIVEACTAVKGQALLRIMSEPSAEKVIYFDPDIAIFNKLDPLVNLLEENSIVLTPHQLDPEDPSDLQAILDNEVASLDYGTFNLGFIGVNQDPEAHRFAQWWAERLKDWCHDRLDIGIFVDQKWCNLIPCFFNSVKILRDPGYNVASWNLSKRTMSYDAEGVARINGEPLRFYHFTKLGPTGDTMTRRYAKENSEIYELWEWYRNEVIKATDFRIPKGWWHYGTYDNGESIDKSARELYRHRQDLRAAFPDPFMTGQGSFFEWLKANK
jgi:hypothetical protein